MAFKDVYEVFELAYRESLAREESPERDSPTLTPIDRLVWAVLAHHKSHETGLCCPGYERLMKFTGLGRTALSASIQRLKNLGYIFVERHGRASRYSWEVPEVAEALPDDEVRETNFSSSRNELQKAARRISEVRETASNRVFEPGKESGILPGSSPEDDGRERYNNSNDKSKDSGRAPNPPVSADDNSPVKYHPDIQFLAEMWKSCWHSDIDLSWVNTWYKKWGTDKLRRAFRFVSLEPIWLNNIPDAETFDSLIDEIMKAADPNSPDSAPPDDDVDWEPQADSPTARPQFRSGGPPPQRRPVSRAKRGTHYNHLAPKDSLRGFIIPDLEEEES